MNEPQRTAAPSRGPRTTPPGVIDLLSGGEFNFLDPRASLFTAEDVARGLSHICRFTGHVDRFYSVAEHSVHCSYLVPDHLALTALCHDAAEAFLGDVSAPLKALLPDYKALEERAEAVVLPRLGARYPIPAAVKHIDMRMLAAEKLQVVGCFKIWPMLSGIDQAAVRIGYWPPRLAARVWLDRFGELGGVRLAWADGAGAQI